MRDSVFWRFILADLNYPRSVLCKDGPVQLHQVIQGDRSWDFGIEPPRSVG